MSSSVNSLTGCRAFQHRRFVFDKSINRGICQPLPHGRPCLARRATKLAAAAASSSDSSKPSKGKGRAWKLLPPAESWGLTAGTWQLLKRHLWALLAVYAVKEALAFVLHRISHRLTNAAAEQLLGLPLAAGGSPWWLMLDPSFLDNNFGYQLCIAFFFMLCLPLNILLNAAAATAAALLCTAPPKEKEKKAGKGSSTGKEKAEGKEQQQKEQQQKEQQQKEQQQKEQQQKEQQQQQEEGKGKDSKQQAEQAPAAPTTAAAGSDAASVQPAAEAVAATEAAQPEAAGSAAASSSSSSSGSSGSSSEALAGPEASTSASAATPAQPSSSPAAKDNAAAASSRTSTTPPDPAATPAKPKRPKTAKPPPAVPLQPPPPTPNPFASAKAGLRAALGTWPQVKPILKRVWWVDMLFNLQALPLQGLSLLVIPIFFTLPRLLAIQLALPAAILGSKEGNDALDTSKAVMDGFKGAYGWVFVGLILASRALDAAKQGVLMAIPVRFWTEVIEIPLLATAVFAVAKLLLARMQDVLPLAAYLSRQQQAGAAGAEAGAAAGAGAEAAGAQAAGAQAAGAGNEQEQEQQAKGAAKADGSEGDSSAGAGQPAAA